MANARTSKKPSRAANPAPPKPPRAAPKTPADEVPLVAGSEAALAKHLAAAEAIPASEVVQLAADPHLAYHNAIDGRDAVLAERAAIDATGFHARWIRIEAIGEIGEALIFAQGQVDPDPKSSGETLALMREAIPLRALLLSDARTQALNNPKLAPDVKKIEVGRGPIDTAGDLVKLSVFFTRNKLAKAGTAVTPAKVLRAAELGSDLLRRLKPAGSKRTKKRTDEQAKAAETRDRMWTLFLREYDHLACAGGARWGRAVVDHIPALQARFVVKKRKPATASTTPASTPTTTPR